MKRLIYKTKRFLHSLKSTMGIKKIIQVMARRIVPFSNGSIRHGASFTRSKANEQREPGTHGGTNRR